MQHGFWRQEFVTCIIFCTLLFVITFPVSKAIKTSCSDDHIVDDSPGIYFVIGIGMYMEGGIWPVYDWICPIFFIRFGNPNDCHILGPKCGERIDFIEGDKFIGYYPFLNPIGIGFVCGIWIDI